MKRFSPDVRSEHGFWMFSDEEYHTPLMKEDRYGEYTLIENVKHTFAGLTKQIERLKNRLARSERAEERLKWVLENSLFRVQGSNEHGWCVLDCSNGITFLTKEKHPDYNMAIDEAMAILAERRGTC
jgi:ribosome-associated translation inhibitor RaiA